MQLCNILKGVFGVHQTQSGQVFASFYSRGRNIDSPQHKEDKAVFKSVTFSGKINTLEGKSESVSKLSHGVFLDSLR